MFRALQALMSPKFGVTQTRRRFVLSAASATLLAAGCNAVHPLDKAPHPGSLVRPTELDASTPQHEPAGLVVRPEELDAAAASYPPGLAPRPGELDASMVHVAIGTRTCPPELCPPPRDDDADLPDSDR
jgi:hypothetical protein